MTTPTVAGDRVIAIRDDAITPVRFPVQMTFNTQDTRAADLYPTLSVVNDTVATIGGITIARVDRLPINAADLTITPSGTTAPWLSANAAGVPLMQVNWWQGVTTPFIALNTWNIDYKISVSFVTTAGRNLTFTVFQSTSLNGC